ncbi:MAG TPA: OmpW family protein [Chryseolinea sp.]|nr:hypothetical protein [Flavobacteriales bacterium]HPM32300.1 OmpW family protein [Chryseolinea sp.]
MKKIFLTFALGLLLIGGLKAQTNSVAAITYSIGFGSGDMGDFISQPSFRGANFDFRKIIAPNIGVGFSIGWNTFYQSQSKDSYTSGNTTLTGKQYRYSNNVPMLASATYFIKPGEKINPFVGLGIGTIYTRRNTDMNLYTLEQEAWNFALQPEVGVLYSLNDQAAITLSGKFNQGFKAGSELTESQSFFTLNIGFAFIK